MLAKPWTRNRLRGGNSAVSLRRPVRGYRALGPAARVALSAMSYFDAAAGEAAVDVAGLAAGLVPGIAVVG